MAFVNAWGYLARKDRSKRNPHGSSSSKDWWLVKHGSKGGAAKINMNHISFSRDFIGKKVRFKLEVIEEE